METAPELRQIRENRIRLLGSLVTCYLQRQDLRVYKKYITGKFPRGYAMTFKVIATKPRRKKK